jgi:RimJ/RimL family protein N-acetyltransferase
VVELRGERVVLRPLRMEDFALIREAQERISPWDPPDPASDRRLKRRIERSGRLVDGWLDLGIEVDGRLVGDIGARRPPAALPPGVFEIGISLFADADRGHGYGADGVRVLTQYLFDELGAARVQASTDVGNVAMRRVLEKLGYAYEGTLRAFMPGTDGARADYALYGATRAEWNTLAR